MPMYTERYRIVTKSHGFEVRSPDIARTFRGPLPSIRTRPQPSSDLLTRLEQLCKILRPTAHLPLNVGHVMKANTSPHLAEQQIGNRNFITGTLADIMMGNRSVDRRRPIIFSPFGMGILDVAVGKWVYDQAVATGREQRLTDFFYETVR